MPTTAPEGGDGRVALPLVEADRTTVSKVDGVIDTGLAQVTRVGEHVYLSGQLALDPDGRIDAPGDCGRQATRCFRNIEGILAAVGGRMSDVVKVVCYLTDAADLAAYAEARRRFLPTVPASTAVVVKALLHEDALLEVDVTAVLPPLPTRIG
nr:RidA family protein [Nocardioides soli]